MKEIISYIVKPKGAPAIDEQIFECLMDEQQEVERTFARRGYDWRITGRMCVRDGYVMRQLNDFVRVA